METLKKIREELKRILDLEQGLPTNLWKAYGKTKQEAVLKFLAEHHDDVYYIVDDEANYFNVYVSTYTLGKENGYLRIYQGNNKSDFRIQLWTPCEMKYSGIPTFPSAQRR